MNNKVLRPAIAMIELIFAIVIMGIALMSAPMLISTATQSSFVTIQQESINEVASQVSLIMGYHWDEGDTDEEYLDPILVVSDGDVNLSNYQNSGWRKGTPKESYRSFVREDGTKNINATSPSNLGNDTNDAGEDDVDDFIGTSNLVQVESSSYDYVEGSGEIELTTRVYYINDSPGGGTYDDPGSDEGLTFNTFTQNNTDSTNIKMIEVTLTDQSDVEELQKKITLRSFVCNIGAYELEKRSF